MNRGGVRKGAGSSVLNQYMYSKKACPLRTCLFHLNRCSRSPRSGSPQNVANATSPRFRLAASPTGCARLRSTQHFLIFPFRTSALAALGQVRNSRTAALSLALLLCSPRFRLAASPTGRARLRAPSMVHIVERPQLESTKNTKQKTTLLGGLLFGGAYWTRTSDPIDVNDVLYQLSQSTMRYSA